MWIAVLSLTFLGLALGTLLGVAARYLKVEENPLDWGNFPGKAAVQAGLLGAGG